MAVKTSSRALHTPVAKNVLLAIETATPRLSVALLEGGEPRASLALSSSQGHGVRLMAAIDALARLADLPRERWQGIAVSAGPGSFTGLRVGMATAKALALGLGIPLYTVPTLEALASRSLAPGVELICPLIDARKGQLFVALYRQTGGILVTVRKPLAVLPLEIPDLVPATALFTGEGFERHARALEEGYGAPLSTAPADNRLADAVAVGRLAMPRLAQSAPSELHSSAPQYVRPPEAEALLKSKTDAARRDRDRPAHRA